MPAEDPGPRAPPYVESALLPLSALQHFLFCPRQCALIHLEQIWVENRLTVEGQHLHKKAHDAPSETRGAVRIVRGLPLRSLALGLIGKADIVELEPLDDSARACQLDQLGSASCIPSGTMAPRARRDQEDSRRSDRDPVRPKDGIAGAAEGNRLAGHWRVTPIEYKRGRPKDNDCDRVQLCAQALCLEEMLGVGVTEGALFYGQRRRRTPVVFEAVLRRRTSDTAAELHQLIATGHTPPAIREPKCDHCSLIEFCLPQVTGAGQSARRFSEREFAQTLTAGGPYSDPFAVADT